MKVQVTNQQTAHKLTSQKTLNQIIRKILTYSNLKVSAQPHDEISVVLTDKSTITELNEHYLKHNGATDVLTFDYGLKPTRRFDSEGVTIGEIFVCTDIAAEVCENHGNSFSVEVVLYIIHGILHLCGHDDQDDTDRAAMKRVEGMILTKLGKEYNLEEIFN